MYLRVCVCRRSHEPAGGRTEPTFSFKRWALDLNYIFSCMSHRFQVHAEVPSCHACLKGCVVLFTCMQTLFISCPTRRRLGQALPVASVVLVHLVIHPAPPFLSIVTHMSPLSPLVTSTQLYCLVTRTQPHPTFDRPMPANVWYCTAVTDSCHFVECRTYI